MKIYISGKMNGDDNFKVKFDIAEGDCIKAGFEVINPANLPRPETWKIALKRDLKILSECDAIYMLSDWEYSKGARLEHWYAKRYNLEIYYEKEKSF
jgi:hypothetical protein